MIGEIILHYKILEEIRRTCMPAGRDGMNLRLIES